MVRMVVFRSRLLVVAACCSAVCQPAFAQTRAVSEESPALERSVRLVLVVDDAEVARRRLQQVASQFGQLRRASGNTVELTVPNARVDAAIVAIDAVGEVTSQNVETKDISLQTEKFRATVRAAKATEARLARLQGVDVTENLQVERARQQATQQVERFQNALRALERKATETAIRIQLQAPPVETLTPPKLPFPWLKTLGPQQLFNAEPQTHYVRELRNYLDGAMRLQGVHAPQRGELSDDLDVLNAVFTVRALGEATPVGVFGGFDMHLGGGTGFSYGAQLLGGVGFPIGQRIGIGVGIGPGVDGVTSRVPIGFMLPIEMEVSLDISYLLAAKIRIRDGWVFGPEERDNGSETAPFGDELSAALHFVVAGRDREGGYSEARDGFEFGAEYREFMGARAYLLTFGYAGHISDFSDRAH